MTLAELLAAVYVETNRPDLVAETTQKVKSATLNLHCIDFFYKDIQSAQVVFDETAYIQQLDTGGLPFYRSLSFLRKNDPTLSAWQQDPLNLPTLQNAAVTPNISMGFIEIITPDNILDEFGVERLDVAYQAGSVVNIKSSTSLLYALIGYYRYPDIKDASFNSWIARELPYAIVYNAASAVLQSIGMMDAARKFDHPETGLATEQVRTLRMNNIVARGY